MSRPPLVTPDEGPSKRRNSPYIFSGSCIPTNESLFILLALPTLATTVQEEFGTFPLPLRGFFIFVDCM